MDGGDWSIFSRIVWEDYIIWMQMSARERVLGVLAGEMEKVQVELGEVGFDLEEGDEAMS